MSSMDALVLGLQEVTDDTFLATQYLPDTCRMGFLKCPNIYLWTPNGGNDNTLKAGPSVVANRTGTRIHFAGSLSTIKFPRTRVSISLAENVW